MITTTAEGVVAARRIGAEAFDRSAEAFRPIDIDGDGIPDKPRALSAVEDASSAIRGAVADAADAIGSAASNASLAIGGLVAGAASAAGSLFQRKQDTAVSPGDVDSETADKRPESPDA